jgi:hypothetical protein
VNLTQERFARAWKRFMKICTTCRSLIIGQEAAEWLPRLEHLLRQHGAVPETLAVVAESLGPMCEKCRKAMDESIKES